MGILHYSVQVSLMLIVFNSVYSKTSQMTTSKVTNLAKWRLKFGELDFAKRPKWPKDLANDGFDTNLKMTIFANDQSQN